MFFHRGGQDHQCSCRGFIFGRGKPCKHIESVRAILENGWMDCPANLDADTSSTEVTDQPEQF